MIVFEEMNAFFEFCELAIQHSLLPSKKKTFAFVFEFFECLFEFFEFLGTQMLLFEFVFEFLECVFEFFGFQKMPKMPSLAV